MSGTFPSIPALAGLKIVSSTPTFVSTAHSLKRQVRSRGGHRWLLEGEYPAMTRDEFAPVYAFAVAQRGRYETFTFVLPGLAAPRGSIPGTPVVDGADQTGRSIDTKGWTASQSGILKAGDFIKFNGSAKVYMVTADADSDGSGNATLSIEPALVTSPGDEEALVVEDVPFTCAFASDIAETSVSPPLLFSFQISMVEVP